MNQDSSQTPQTDTPPDHASAGDVSSTGHSSHDVQDAHGASDGHGSGDSHGGGHGGHGHADDTSEVPTLVPTTLSQLILPAIILLFVMALVAGPVLNAFATRPAAPPAAEEHQGAGQNQGQAPESGATAVQSESKATAAPTTASTAAPTEAPATPTTSAGAPLAPTQTAVALAGQQGDVARVPVTLELGGDRFNVKPGSGLLPDWKPSPEEGTATWIEGTVANHILYVSYNPRTEALFRSAKVGDIVRLAMNTGQVFEFSVTKTDRAINGPAESGKFNVGSAMLQDHAGVTVFLIGDPSPDRAVIQGDFTGNIQ